MGGLGGKGGNVWCLRDGQQRVAGAFWKQKENAMLLFLFVRTVSSKVPARSMQALNRSNLKVTTGKMDLKASGCCYEENRLIR